MDWWMWPLLAWLPLTSTLAVLWRRPLRRPADVVRPRLAEPPAQLPSVAPLPVDRAA